MIETITSLKISGRCFPAGTKLKCFCKDTSRISIIYGKNGSGKSTLAKSLCNSESDLSCLLLDKNDNTLHISKEQLYIFNEDYIKEKVEIQSDGLEAVVLFGEQVDIDKQINEANVEINKLQGIIDDENSKKRCFEDVKKHGSYKYNEEKLKEKLKSRDNWVARKFAISGKRPNVTTNIFNEIFEKPKFSHSQEEAFALYKRSMSIIGTAAHGKIDGEIKPLMFEHNFFQHIYELLAEKIEEPVLNNREKSIIGIYNQKGAQYISEIKNTFENKDQNLCPYCFRTINNNEKELILSVIENILSQTAKDHKDELNQCFKQITQKINMLDKIITIADELKDIYIDEYDKFESQYKIVNSILAEYIQEIENKMNSIYSPILFPDKNIEQNLQKLNDFISCLESKRNDYNQQIDKINKSKEKAVALNNEIAYWEFGENYVEYCKTYNDYNNCCESLIKHQKEFDVQKFKIDKLNSKKKNVVIAKDNINKALSYVFFSNDRLQLDVDAENGKYYLMSKNIRIAPDKVSTGERNIIALCYFFTQILNNHNSTYNFSDEYFIVIDDPISSFDRENQVGVITYLKYQFSEILHGNQNSKILLLSHDLASVYDFEKVGDEIGRGIGHNNYVENYELKNQAINSSDHIDANRHEYSELMKEIYKYANDQKSLISNFTIGNSMRRLLEAYGTFVYKKGIDALTTNEEILNLCKNHKNFFRNYMYRLVLNGESHYKEMVLSLHDPNFFENFTSEQLKDTAQKIICYLYLINPLHVKEHLYDRKNSLGNYIDVIERWIQNIPTD